MYALLDTDDETTQNFSTYEAALSEIYNGGSPRSTKGLMLLTVRNDRIILVNGNLDDELAEYIKECAVEEKELRADVGFYR